MERNDRQTMERVMKWAFALIATGLLSGCDGNSYHPEFKGLPHKGRQTMSVTGLHMDTLLIDGSSTSLIGDWLLKGDRLYFVDQSLCGLRSFDLDGEYLGRHIRSGRGPNEWPSPFVKAKFHGDELVAVEGNWFFTVYDSSYVRQGEPFNLLQSYGLGNRGWQDLLRHPDVEAPAMYEYNLEASNIVKVGDMFVIPVVTEHVSYNGLSRTSHSRDFWRRSYTFMRLDVHGGGTAELFGHYPEIYTEKNIPIFASYSFDRCADGIVTSFGADSLLYVRDTTGRPLYTFGYSARGMSHDYPETNTIDSYMENYQGYREKYSYYTDIKSVGEYLFRSYKLDGEDRYGLQIYKGHDLIGEVATGDPLTVLGEYGGYWYASIPADIENDLLRIVKFRL